MRKTEESDTAGTCSPISLDMMAMMCQSLSQQIYIYSLKGKIKENIIFRLISREREREREIERQTRLKMPIMRERRFEMREI